MGEPTLGDLVADLAGVAVLVGGTKLDLPAGDVVVHGPGETLVRAPAGLLVLTGTPPAGPEATSLVDRVHAAGYHAIAVKALGRDLADLCRGAAERELVVLRVPDATSWRSLDVQLVTGYAAAGFGPDPAGAGVTPGDLFALADAVAAAVGGAVTVEDPHGRVLAYSHDPRHEIDEVRRLGILGRRTPQYHSTTDNYRIAVTATRATAVPAMEPDVADRLVAPVLAAGRLLGLIWVIADRPPLRADALRLLDETTRGAALHLLRATARRDPARARRSEVVAKLLAGESIGSVATNRLGATVTSGAAVLALAPVPPTPATALPVAGVLELAVLHAELWHPDATCVVDLGVVYIVLPGVPGREHGLGNELLRAARTALDVRIVVAVGPWAAGPDQLGAARRAADRLLDLLLGDPPDAASDQVVSVADRRPQIALAAVREAALADGLLLDGVRAVLRHDAEHDTDYAATLLAWAGAAGDVGIAAQRLSVHANTLRYRLRRLPEMFGLDLSDPDQLLVSWLQLRLLTRPAEPETPAGRPAVT